MDLYRHFGLISPPFAVTPDPRMAYETRDHKLALLKIAYSVQERRGIFLLRGDVGVGKTTVLNLLARDWSSRAEEYAVAHLTTPTTRSQALFLREIMTVLGLATARNLKDLNRILLEFLVECHRKRRAVVVLLDEAQIIALPNLSLLHLLSNHQTMTEQLLQIVLFAQPNIENKLVQAPAFRSRITGTAYLSPLSFDDAIGMLRHRIGVVGGNFETIFPPETHKPVYNATAGVCRDLCVLCNDAMMNAAAFGKKAVDVDAVAEAVENMRFKLKGAEKK